MYTHSSQVSMLRYRHKVIVWVLLVAFSWPFLPAVSLAQQPTATIATLSGTVLVNGQAGNTGAVLNAGDVIETQAGASVVLQLSDGSQVELGEKTKLDLAALSQSATGARTSRLKLWWGWIRAKVSPDHQKVGSAFEVETPNTLVGVKFSQPEFEISYNQEKQETTAKALTVALLVLNLLTNEKVVVPIGATVVITNALITVSSAVAGGALSAKTIAIGAGALGVVGLGIAVAGGGGDGGGDGSTIPSAEGNWNMTMTWINPPTKVADDVTDLSNGQYVDNVRMELKAGGYAALWWTSSSSYSGIWRQNGTNLAITVQSPSSKSYSIDFTVTLNSLATSFNGTFRRSAGGDGTCEGFR